MGFGSALKGANNSWGTCTGFDFEGLCYIGPKNFVDNRDHTVMISGTSLQGEYCFQKEDVREMQYVAVTSEWVKILITFNDGKRVVATFMMMESDGRGGQKMSMGFMNFEWWFAEKLYA